MKTRRLVLSAFDVVTSGSTGIPADNVKVPLPSMRVSASRYYKNYIRGIRRLENPLIDVAGTFEGDEWEELKTEIARQRVELDEFDWKV